MLTIDKMIELCRKEEQDDIDHKNRCEGAQTKNKYDTEDLNHAITKSEQTLKRMESEESELGDKIKSVEGEINGTKTDMDEAKKMRIAESENFIQAMKDDTDAIGLLQNAITALTRFYSKPSASLA